MTELTNMAQLETVQMPKIDFPRFDQVFDQAKNWWSEQGKIGQRNVDKRIKEAGLWVQQRKQEWLSAFQEISKLSRQKRAIFFENKLGCSEKTAADLAVLVEVTSDGLLSGEQEIAVKNLSQTMASVADQPTSQPEIENFLLAMVANGQDLSVAPSDDVPAWLKDKNSKPVPAQESSNLPPPESIPPKKKSSKKEKQDVPIGQIPAKERKNKWGLVNTGAPIVAGVLIMCFALYLTVGRFTEGAIQKSEGSQNLPPEYANIMKADSYLADIIQQARGAGLGQSEDPNQKTDTLAYKVIGEYNNALIYLQGGSAEQWGSLGNDLEEGNINSLLGQHAALKKANCLIGNRYVNKATCEAQNPNFVKAGDDYIQKYNAAIDRLWQKYPSLRPKGVPLNYQERTPGLDKTALKLAKSSYRPRG